MEWLSEYGFTILQTVSIIASLLFTAFTIRSDARERRIENLFTITEAHREIWRMVLEKPELRRVLEASLPKEDDGTPTLEERLFLRALIHHLAASFRARTLGMYFHEHGLAADVRQFFSRPIPRAVWESMRHFQEPDFVQFVDAELPEAGPSQPAP